MSGESMNFAQATPKWQKPRLVKYFTWKSTVSTELQRLDMERGLIEKELDAMVPQDSPQMTSALDATRTRVLTRSATARAEDMQAGAAFERRKCLVLSALHRTNRAPTWPRPPRTPAAGAGGPGSAARIR